MDKKEQLQSSTEQNNQDQDWDTVKDNDNQFFNQSPTPDDEPAVEETQSDTVNQISDNAAAFIDNSLETPNEYATINAEIYQTVMPNLLESLNTGRENQVSPEQISRLENTCDILMSTYFENKNENTDLVSALESRKAAYQAAAQAYRDDLDDEQAAIRNLELAECTDELIEQATSAQKAIEYKNDPNSTYVENRAAFID